MTPRDPGALLPRALLAHDAVALAPRLLGCTLQRDEVVLRITEVEAYPGPWDSASHSRMGPTARNRPMFGPPGHAYVYLVYGLHHLVNVVVGAEGVGAAVLIRAATVWAGHDEVAARRGGRRGPDVAAGPGRVGAALGVDTTWSGHDLLAAGGLELRDGAAPAAIRTGPRVGIAYAAPHDRDAPWRFTDAAAKVSAPRMPAAP